MPTPRDVLIRLIEGVPAGRWDELPTLYAENATVEQPMALPEPVRLVGREALAAHFAAAGRLPLRMQARNIVIHETDDPEVVVGEFDYACEHLHTGQRFTVANVFLVRVRDGLIVASRDHTDHARFAAAFGRLDAIAKRS